MEHKDILELIPAYALNVLEEEEAEVVGRHLTGCETCRAELAAYNQVTDQLAFAVADAQPAAHLKQRLMARIETGEETAVSSAKPGLWQTITTTLQTWLSGPRRQPVAAVAVLLLLVSSVFLWQQWRQTSALPGQQIPLASTDVAPEAQGVIHISEDGHWGTLIVENLPELPADRQYQLWLIKDGERISGGVFSVPDHGYFSLSIASPESLGNYSAFGITIEPFGGSPGPTGERVLGYNL